MKGNLFATRGIFGGRLLVVSLAVALLPGCSSSSKGTLVPVSGTMTVNDQPLQHGTVVFHPDPDRGNNDKREPRGVIAAEQPGAYRLTTDNKDGAPSGWYKVTVNAIKPSVGMRPTEWIADQKYADEKTSGLSVEVLKDAKTGAYDFKLDPPQ